MDSLLFERLDNGIPFGEIMNPFEATCLPPRAPPADNTLPDPNAWRALYGNNPFQQRGGGGVIIPGHHILRRPFNTNVPRPALRQDITYANLQRRAFGQPAAVATTTIATTTAAPTTAATTDATTAAANAAIAATLATAPAVRLGVNGTAGRIREPAVPPLIRLANLVVAAISAASLFLAGQVISFLGAARDTAPRVWNAIWSLTVDYLLPLAWTLARCAFVIFMVWMLSVTVLNALIAGVRRVLRWWMLEGWWKETAVAYGIRTQLTRRSVTPFGGAGGAGTWTMPQGVGGGVLAGSVQETGELTTAPQYPENGSGLNIWSIRFVWNVSVTTVSFALERLGLAEEDIMDER